MKKKISIISLSILIICTLAVGCSSKNELPVSEQSAKTASLPENYVPTENIALGITLMLPKDLLENDTLMLQDPWIMFGDLTKEPEVTDTTPEQNLMCYYLPFEGEYPLFGIMRYEETKWETLIDSGKTPSEITGVEKTTEIGRKNNLVYLFTEPDTDTSSFTDEQKAVYEDLKKNLPAIMDSTQLSLSAETAMTVLPDFSVETLDGTSYDHSIFDGHKVTMINLWATFCGPCIEEMPVLEEMSRNMPEGTQMIGIICDVTDETRVNAENIIAETGVTYPNLIAEDSLLEYVMENVIAYPTTIFVDENGKLIGDAIVGDRSREVYESILEERLGF